ncbi:MAG: amidohydrolase family protein [Clostridia bacterium]|nr:amidohydrolase family protein [Clostridia bacterium]
MICIKNASVIVENSILNDGVILVDGEKIAKVGKRGEVCIPDSAEIIDAEGLYVAPGFVDIHVHGGGDSMFHDDPVKAAKHFLKHGETTVLATLYYDLEKDRFLEAIDKIKTAMNEMGNIGGFYMEGPYMNPKYGASPEKNKWKGEIKADDYKAIVDRAGKDALVWAVAPEREGLEPFMAYAKSVNSDVAFAVGHSQATPYEVQSLKKYGIKIQTHCTNATGRVNESGGVRGVGPDEACFLDDDIYAEVICDSLAIHVKPDMIKLIIKIKGMDKVILISDSFVSYEPNPEEYSHVTDLSFDANGGLCGSKLTLDAAARNFMKHTGRDICDAFKVTSTNPARAVGLFDKVGSIEEGKYANLIFTDKDINVKKVMLKGRMGE